MIKLYTVFPKEEISRQGETWISCDYAEYTPPVWEGTEYDEDGAIVDRGTLVQEAVEGPKCTNTAKISPPTEITKKTPTRTVIELVASLPEGWASSSDNALEGGADFCPEHADCISIVPEGIEAPAPIVES